MSKGNINVSVENIFPLIKKFLYSDHEIFLYIPVLINWSATDIA